MQSFGGVTEEKVLLTLSCRWEDIINMDFRELGWEAVYWILYSVGLLGWLMSPEVSACAALYSTCVHVLYSVCVCIIQHRCVRIVQCSFLYCTRTV
jgi:hypothetical protein